MNNFKSLATLLLFSLAIILFSVKSSHAGDVVNLEVGLHQAELVSLPKDMTNVIIADRSIAGVVKHDSRKISVTGHGIGRTDIRVMSGDRIVREINVTVTHNLPEIRRSLSLFFPNETIGVENVNGTVALTGMISNAETAAKAEKVVSEYLKTNSTEVINLMKLRSGQQVMLRVRVGEIKRTALKKLGLGLQGIISAGSTVFGALAKEGAFKVMSEPTLTAISGETAEFLAGGEFPVPVSQANNTMSVDYKSFGVSVGFTPVVLSQNRIRLDVASEVSELSKAGAVSVRSINIPSITTRRANTTVELAPGESFMIAGLVSESSASNINDVPALASIPILGSLFRSADFRKNQSELVIAVTPYLVDPVEGAEIRMPTDNYDHANMFEMMFFGKLGEYKGKKITGGKQSGLEGSVGYLVD